MRKRNNKEKKKKCFEIKRERNVNETVKNRK